MLMICLDEEYATCWKSFSFYTFNLHCICYQYDLVLQCDLDLTSFTCHVEEQFRLLSFSQIILLKFVNFKTTLMY
jgi:hypothetical protein